MTRLMEIEKRKLYCVQGNIERQLTSFGCDEVTNLLYGYFRTNHLFRGISFSDLSTKEIDDVEIGYERYRGRLVNRISSFIYKEYGLSLSDSFKSLLAETIANNMYGGKENIYFDVVDYIRWRPGTFKEFPSSCWWNRFTAGKKDFQKEMKRGEAAAIRLFRPAAEKDDGVRKWYKDYVGIGRCFAVVNNPIGVDIIFNGYGIELNDWKTLLQEILGYRYAIQLRNQFGALVLGDAYINGGTGIALYDDMKYAISSYREPNFGFYSVRLCKDCGNKYRSEDSYDYCKGCQGKYYVSIRSSWKPVPIEDAIQIEIVGPINGHIQKVWTTEEELNKGIYIKCQDCQRYCLKFHLDTAKCIHCQRK